MHLGTEEKATIVGMSRGCMTPKQIANETGVALPVVYYTLNCHKKRGTVETPARPGRPPVLSDRARRAILKEALTNRRATLAQITNNLPIKVSTKTVRKALCEDGVNSRVARKKPNLTDRHKANRLAFAKKYQHWTVEDWRKVVWTDESTF